MARLRKAKRAELADLAETTAFRCPRRAATDAGRLQLRHSGVEFRFAGTRLCHRLRQRPGHDSSGSNSGSTLDTLASAESIQDSDPITKESDAMESKQQTRLANAYVRDCFDSRIATLSGSFTDERWHSTPIREFEYRQTERAIRKALGKRRYGRVLEIGPGDGVWTPLVRDHAAGPIHLVEQSEELLRRARERLSRLSGLSYEHCDFLISNPPSGNDLVFAIRCFEYLEDQIGALHKMRELLAPGGRIIIVTNNAELLTRRSVQVDAMRRG